MKLIHPLRLRLKKWLVKYVERTFPKIREKREQRYLDQKIELGRTMLSEITDPDLAKAWGFFLEGLLSRDYELDELSLLVDKFTDKKDVLRDGGNELSFIYNDYCDKLETYVEKDKLAVTFLSEAVLVEKARFVDLIEKFKKLCG